jgi:hypothetical protein
MEAGLAERHTGRMSGPEFRAFQARRSDHERWELLGGVAVMMTPPTLTHNQIATNLPRLLDDALERHDPSLLAAQRPGLELGSGDDKPEPDVGVIDADFDAGQRFVERAHLLAEVVSESDDVAVPGTNRRWVDVKRAISTAPTNIARRSWSSPKTGCRWRWISGPRPAGSRRSWREAALNCRSQRSASDVSSPISTTRHRCSRARPRDIDLCPIRSVATN